MKDLKVADVAQYMKRTIGSASVIVYKGLDLCVFDFGVNAEQKGQYLSTKNVVQLLTEQLT